VRPFTFVALSRRKKEKKRKEKTRVFFLSCVAVFLACKS